MDLPPKERELRDQFLRTLLEATFPLKAGPDPELALELLIQATGMLKEHLEQELEEIRLESAE